MAILTYFTLIEIVNVCLEQPQFRQIALDQQDHASEITESKREKRQDSRGCQHLQNLLFREANRGRVCIQNDCGASCGDQYQRRTVILPYERFAEVPSRENQVADDSSWRIASHQGQVEIWKDDDMDAAGTNDAHYSEKPLALAIGFALLGSVLIVLHIIITVMTGNNIVSVVCAVFWHNRAVLIVFLLLCQFSFLP